MEDAKFAVAEGQAAIRCRLEPDNSAKQDESPTPTETTRISYPTQIFDGATRQIVEAVIIEGMDEATAKEIDSRWTEATSVLLTRLATTNPDAYEEPEHSHWRWEQKVSFMQRRQKEYSFLMLECRNETQGMACITLGEPCHIRAQEGNALVYIEYISTAPWNNKLLLAKVERTPRYSGVGSALLSMLIEYSIKRGFCGRIGLHALPQAASFYRDVCGMTEFGVDASHEGLQYFEFTEEQAQAFLEGE